ncbi:hypothetical protein RFI_12581 [Reticulomyxa filosa]|uniref:Chromo domain-containing protein n=1 Tax=Reticulomyxa filosa TaxID=46433 RepID=X6NEZ8_RETFI|nr:hypothetical protein RFI_12581 [Reticulomyxa filosa]|eukprot:ETO24576.1 hypothetical protein RFI_12581 [Reticulomyxa filosa]
MYRSNEEIKKDLQQVFNNFEKICVRSSEHLKLLQVLQTKYFVRAHEIETLEKASVKSTVGSIDFNDCGPQTMPEFPNQPKTLDECIQVHNPCPLKERIELKHEKIDKIEIEKILDEKMVETICEGVIRLLLVKYKKYEKPTWESYEDVVRYFPKEISRYFELKKREIRGVHLKYPEGVDGKDTLCVRVIKECPKDRRKEYIPRPEDFEPETVSISTELRNRLRKIADEKRKRFNQELTHLPTVRDEIDLAQQQQKQQQHNEIIDANEHKHTGCNRHEPLEEIENNIEMQPNLEQKKVNYCWVHGKISRKILILALFRRTMLTIIKAKFFTFNKGRKPSNCQQEQKRKISIFDMDIVMVYVFFFECKKQTKKT